MKKKSKANKKTYVNHRLPRLNAHAFSTFELIIVIALVIVVGLSSIPFLSRFFTQSATSDTYNRLLAEFRTAQTNAMLGKQNGPWGVYYGTVNGSKEVILYQGTSYATHTNKAFDQVYAVNPNVTVTGLSDVNFTQMSGIPNTSTTITITGTSNTTKTIQIDTHGIVNYAAAGPTNTPVPPTPTPTIAMPTVDNATYFSEGSNLGATWVTGPFTVNANNSNYLLVGIKDRYYWAGPPPGIKYGSAQMTLIGVGAVGTDTSNLYFFGLLNPPTGANTFTITQGNSGSYYAMVSEIWHNINQSTPYGNFYHAQSNNVNGYPSISLTNTTSGRTAVDFFWDASGPTSDTPGTGQTQIVDQCVTCSSTGGTIGSSYKLLTGSSTTMYWNNGYTGGTTGSNWWGMDAVELIGK